MKEMFGIERSKRGFFIHTINNPTVIFAIKVLASKLLRKVHPDQCTMGAIAFTDLCASETQINWCQFLLNELIQDATDAQERGWAFHYSWLLILISFIGWYE